MIALSPETVTVLFVVGLLVAVLSGYPIALALGAVGLVLGVAALGPAATFQLLYTRVYQLIQTYALIATPLFVFMGLMLEKSQVVAGLFDALYLWLGKLRGGLAVSTVLFGTLLAACLGIVAASITMLTVMALGEMLQRGYDKGLASGAVVAGGCLGILIPPSVMLVFYGPMAGISVGRLFIGAVFPGLLLSMLYCTYILVRARLQPSVAPAAPVSEEVVSLLAKTKILLKSLFPPLVLVFAVLGSIFLGIAAPTEAAGVGAFGAIALTIAYRRFSFRIMKAAALDTARMVGFIFFIGAFSYAIVGIFIRAGGGEVVRSFLMAAPFGRWGAFVIIMLLLFILGMFIDWIGIVFIMVPIVSPVMQEMGFDPLWFGLMVCVNFQMSFLTPPFAPGIFICLGAAPPELGITMTDIVRGVIPFIILVIIALVLCAVFPDILLWLPSQMMG